MENFFINKEKPRRILRREFYLPFRRSSARSAHILVSTAAGFFALDSGVLVGPLDRS